MKYYAYFFTRQDIPNEQQLVQTAHVALVLGNCLRPDQLDQLHFACCGVDNLQELLRIEHDLKQLGHEFVVFRDDIFNDEMTAIGVYPIEDSKRGILRNEKSLKFKDKYE